MRRGRIIALLCAMLALSTIPVNAKRATIGVYAIVDKVEFEPNEGSPQRIRVHGIFVVPLPMSSGQYKTPQRGYLYFAMRPGMKQAVMKEWNDLKALAGSGQAIGFGQYWAANPADPSGNPHHSLEVQVHRDGDSVAPEVYPLPHAKGIVRAGSEADPDFERIVSQLYRVDRG